MCVAVPMRLTARQGAQGVVEQGGVRYRVDLSLLEDATVGQYLLIHAGFAITALDEDDALQTLRLLEQAGVIAPAAGPGTDGEVG